MRYQTLLPLLLILGCLASGCARESDAVASATAPAPRIEKKPVVTQLEVTGERYAPGVMHPHEFSRGEVVRVIVTTDPPVKNLSAVWSTAGGVVMDTPAPREEASRRVFESGDTSSWQRGIHRIEIRADGQPVAHTAFTLL